MHTLARYWGILLGLGLLVAAEPALPLPGVPLPPIRERGPSLGEPSLPTPRTLPTTPPREEPAPAPREQSILPGAPPFAARSREEAAPMPQERNPAPPRLVSPGYPRTAPSPEVQALHREIEGLKMECEAMLVEEVDLLTKKDPHAPQVDESARLRRRITDLLSKAAQMPPKAPAQTPPANSRRKPVVTRGSSAPRLDNQPAQANHSPAASAPPAHPTPAAPSANPAKPPANAGKMLTDAPVDPLALAQTLFLAGDHTGALNVYRRLEKEEQRLDERVTIQYMLACCLRKLGKADEAAIMYREVANSGGNDALVENSQWHLRTMKERHELEAQFDELRQRRYALTPRKP